MSAAIVAETVDRILSAALAEFECLQGLKLLSPARSASGIAFDFSDQFKTALRTGVQSKVRARLEGYLSTPVKEGRPKSPTESSWLRFLSKGRVAKLHIENEAKKQTAERAWTKESERVRRLSDGLNEKASHALEKRKDVLAEISQKAKKHAEAVDDKMKRVQEAEEHRCEELKSKLEPSHALEKRKEFLAEVSQKARKHFEAFEDKLKRVQEAQEHRREELKAKLDPSHALETRKEFLAEVSQKARKHFEAVEVKLKRVQEAEEHRREELKAKLDPSHALEKRKEFLAEVCQKAKKHAEAVDDKMKWVQEAEEHRREELKAKLDPSHALEKRKEFLAEVCRKARKHAEAVEDKLKRVQEAQEHRREELKAKLERKTGSKVSGKVSDGLESPAGAASKKFQPPARAVAEATAAPCRLSESELQPGWVILSAALADFEGLEGMMFISPERNASGIAFDLSDQFKTTPSTDVQLRARARLEGYLSTPVKEGRPKSPTEDSLPRLLSKGLASKLHIKNEAKKQTAERARTKKAKRVRRLSDGLSEKASHALEKRKEVLAEVSRKAKKHAEAVEDKLKRVQETEEHRREELRAKLERKTGSKVSGKVSDGLKLPLGAASKKFQPPARAGGETTAAPRRPSEPELQSGWVIITGVTEEVA